MSDAVGTAIDRATFDGMLEAVGGDPSFLAELVDAFAGDAPAQIATMRTALATGDASVLTRGAHTLKSSAASLGALALSEHCGALEARARAGDLDGADAAIDVVEVAARRAVTELRDLVAGA